jgi:hypothetical protein
MARITPTEARAYLDRWAAVEEFEIAERRRTPMAKKARQLSALMASRHLFPPDPDREKEVEQVRRHWALLRKALGG